MRKESRVLVCVTGQKSCARLIHDGAEIAAEENKRREAHAHG